MKVYDYGNDLNCFFHHHQRFNDRFGFQIAFIYMMMNQKKVELSHQFWFIVDLPVPAGNQQKHSDDPRGRVLKATQFD